MSAAFGVLLTEFAFRTLTSGFYGAITQAFRRVETAWAAKDVLVVGEDTKSLWQDLKEMPGLIESFVAAGPVA